MELEDNCQDVIFKELICFKMEVMNPHEMKKHINKLVYHLNHIGIRHENRVITKVVEKNPLKKTITLMIHIPVVINEKIKEFLKEYPMYEYKELFRIGTGYKITISNKMEEFKQAVELFLEKMNNGKTTNLQSYDVSDNNIIEVSRIGYHAEVLGFDLYMEI